MKLLALEFCKCRRRKLTLVCAGLLAAQLLWFGAYLTRQDAEALAQGWMLLLYNLAMVDAIMLPIGVAVIASRSCELEHRGHTLKLCWRLPSPPVGSTPPSWPGAPWCWPACSWRAAPSFGPWALPWASPAGRPGGGSWF